MCGDEREGETERTCGRDGKIETGTPQVRETGKEVTGYVLANRRKEFIHMGERLWKVKKLRDELEGKQKKEQ